MTVLNAREGMTGSLVVKGVKSHQYKSFKVDGSDWPPKYWKVLLELEGDVSLAFSDARRFARVRLQVRLNCSPVPVQLNKITSGFSDLVANDRFMRLPSCMPTVWATQLQLRRKMNH